MGDGRLPRHDEYIDALHNITKYCPKPPERTLWSTEDINACWSEAEQYVRHKYTTEIKYFKAFTDEEIAGIEEWMPTIAGHWCWTGIK